MSNKKLSEKTYKILETEGTHTVASKDTRGATRAMEFEDGTNKLVGPAELVEVESRTPKRYEDFSTGGQLVIGVAEIIVPKITGYLTEKAISSFDNWLKNRRKQNKKKQSVKKESITTRKTKAEQILESKNAKIIEMARCESHIPSTEFDSVYEEYRINMTSEEVQKELIDIFMLEVIRAKKIWKVSHANIVDAQDSNGAYLEGKVLIERLSNPEVLSNINTLLESKSELLEEWETIALSDILGRSLVKDGQFIPIESVSFKNALTVSR
ncbi:hypothetical protein N4T77_14880 [Clostridium sp. CX1]|uniref:hypothetical protein n=1 Tax=Clostridium sp. CX1 TaxID=2978346 RepID=UPI0021BE88A1|nr:hypothetical protein [Clostridium sp. CX1]MCT8977882.1 hypothetical protein [Clostridium sp. CX1]